MTGFWLTRQKFGGDGDDEPLDEPGEDQDHDEPLEDDAASNEHDQPQAALSTLPATDVDMTTDDLEDPTSSSGSTTKQIYTPASSESIGVSQDEHITPQSNNATHSTEHAAEVAANEWDLKPAEALIQPDMSVVRLIQEADHSAGKLVNLLAKHFPCFQDQGRFDGRKVRFLKRAQILVADLWAAFNGRGQGEFYDIGHLTMFAGECPPCETRILHDWCIVTPLF